MPSPVSSQIQETFGGKHRRNYSDVVKIYSANDKQSMSGSQAGTELAIKEQNTMENLKDSYEN